MLVQPEMQTDIPKKKGQETSEAQMSMISDSGASGVQPHNQDRRESNKSSDAIHASDK